MTTAIWKLLIISRNQKHMTIVDVRALFLALFTASVSLSMVLGQSSTVRNYVYTLQERAVSFTQEPLSQAVLLGSTVTFNCVASVKDLPIRQHSDYTLPTFSWRHNGLTLPLPNDASNKWEITSNITHSELHINDVSESDSGYYECVSSDGLHMVNDEDRYVAITISRKASLEIIVLSNQTVELEEAVNVSLGGHLLLNCNTGASHDPHQVTWKKDGVILTTAEIAELGATILNNSSLLIFNVTAATAGRYQCIGWYSEEAVNGTTSYDVAITNTSVITESAVILDAPSVQGNTLQLTCYVIGEEIQTVEWLKDDVQIILGFVVESTSTILTTVESGVYTCRIIGSTIQASTTVLSPPRISGAGQVRPDETKVVGDLVRVPLIKLECELSEPPSPSTVIYWYKDGENITDYYNSATEELNYVVEHHEVDSLFGVYQCFAENSAGVDYTITRVLPRGFSNPPGNFTCITVDQDDSDHPRFILNWDRPSLVPGAPDPNTVEITYQLIVEMGVNSYTYSNIRTSDYIIDDFEVDGNYEFTVFIPAAGNLRGGANATCIVGDSFLDRRERVVRELDVSCPTSLNEPIVVNWMNPRINPLPGSSRLIEPVVNFISVCLYANHSLEPSEDYLYYYDERLDTERVTLLTEEPVPGAVCLFGGYYKLSDSVFSEEMYFTPVTCSFPTYELTAAVQLRVSCSDSVSNVTWWSSSSVNAASVSVQGVCRTPTWDQKSLNVTLLNGESGSITGLPDNSVCTFYGSYQIESGGINPLDPVQCIMGRNISLLPAPQPPMTTSTSAGSTFHINTILSIMTDTKTNGTTGEELTQKTTTLEHTATTKGFQQKVFPVVFSLVGILVVAIIIATILIVVCCVIRYVHGMSERYKQQRHMWYTFDGSEDITKLEDPPIQPDYPPLYKMCKEIEEDSQSRLTHVDYLYREELGSTHISETSLVSLVKSFNPPSVVAKSEPMIMNRFLEDSLWESKSDAFHSCKYDKSDLNDFQNDPKDSETTNIHESELQDKLHSCAVMSEPPAHLQIDHEFIQLVKDAPVAVHPPDYKHSAASSGYCTESETYFSSSTTDYPHTHGVSEYFRKRDAELSEMMSTCEEEQRVVDADDLNTKASLHTQAISDPELAQDLSSPEVIKTSNSSQSLPTLCSGHFRPTCAGHTHKELDNFKRNSDSSSGSTPLYLNYTDEEGYLHLEYRESDTNNNNNINN